MIYYKKLSLLLLPKSCSTLMKYENQNYEEFWWVNETLSIEVECEKLLELDHYDHAEIIQNLQFRKNPYAIPYLKKVVALKPQLSYLDYDYYGAFYKKCFWALESIGTEESIAVIQLYTSSLDKQIRDEARYRLAKITGCPTYYPYPFQLDNKF